MNDSTCRAGCTTVLIDYAYAEPPPPHAPDHTAPSLSDAAAWILAQPDSNG